MFAISPVRLFFMVIFGAIAMLFALGPLLVSVLALADLQNWGMYATPYLTSVVLACVFTALVYVVRDIDIA
jgi:hypothetical protein